jgi:hypothetical protein
MQLRHNMYEKLWRVSLFIKSQSIVFFHLSPIDISRDDLKVRDVHAFIVKKMAW